MNLLLDQQEFIDISCGLEADNPPVRRRQRRQDHIGVVLDGDRRCRPARRRQLQGDRVFLRPHASHREGRDVRELGHHRLPCQRAIGVIQSDEPIGDRKHLALNQKELIYIASPDKVHRHVIARHHGWDIEVGIVRNRDNRSRLTLWGDREGAGIRLTPDAANHE